MDLGIGHSPLPDLATQRNRKSDSVAETLEDVQLPAGGDRRRFDDWNGNGDRRVGDGRRRERIAIAKRPVGDAHIGKRLLPALQGVGQLKRVRASRTFAPDADDAAPVPAQGVFDPPDDCIDRVAIVPAACELDDGQIAVQSLVVTRFQQEFQRPPAEIHALVRAVIPPETENVDDDIDKPTGGHRLVRSSASLHPAPNLVVELRECAPATDRVCLALSGPADVEFFLERQNSPFGLGAVFLTVDLAFARLPLEHLFETVVGGDETEHHKPHPAPLQLALERLDAAPEDAAYVGDSPFDMQAAKAAGLYAIGVSWGRIHTADKLSDADVIVDRPEELLELV